MATEKSYMNMAADGQTAKSTESFLELVRDRQPITLGSAYQYMATLDPEQNRIGGCYKLRCAKHNRTCSGRCIGYACPMKCCCGCLWTPAFFFLADCLIGLCFCASKSKTFPGTYSCVDGKGNFYATVPVDDEAGTLAWFSENQACGSKGRDLEVACYCEK
mmetsp:Transcript_10332/g.26447  ORF Transcript_10332/g.26447 Transcript_10332/m.26447 type:complete len:161 (-) Transcript_10332:139-621(-)|eukprot:CAMPEP_0182927860 /NCGR_PEP_ID=MMETSP0105_2-20130417/14442_1 /TAXON_ID=81532 ORGANISM="Acanthoeca-like sp., Strain 10tr" /NCGR_SAMPLE_ID=MMETSP0105_2 /ASSEMBLY_ACC=CAM_ASM_000205 /LENGTH=160 /DNA_ID=CAMNT_0025065829 /DNA_START=104 /DNA_END=586 /DNA_ORIENTATION=+